jgi:hypothetical protein
VLPPSIPPAIIATENFFEIYFADNTKIIDGNRMMNIDEVVEVILKTLRRCVVPSNGGTSGDSPQNVQMFKRMNGDRSETIIPKLPP